MDDAAPEFPPEAFARLDEGDDAEFYLPVRLVTHIDDNAITALRAFYGKQLKPDGTILDLMSSWVSHLPDDLPLAEVIGHGMNADELAQNPRLTRCFVQDLNADPGLPLPDGSLDAALCCVSVQYLQRPVDVFAQVRRVLRPGAPFIVSFSNRCFLDQGRGDLALAGPAGSGTAGVSLFPARGLFRHWRACIAARITGRSADRRGRSGLKGKRIRGNLASLLL